MKNKNFLQMLESHVDKIVLAVYILISLFLLWIYVIGNPYGQKVRIGAREKNYAPGQIDSAVLAEAKKAIPLMDAPPEHVTSIPPQLPEYTHLVECSISDISSSIYFPYPDSDGVTVQEERLYALPEIPSLADVTVGRLRGAAKIPTQEIAPDQTYNSASSEIGDIDLITVSARIDIQALYNNFQQSFMGPRLKTSWKDSRLAQPVFAQLNLERRVQQDDGSWGPWETVPRPQIDSYRKLIQDLPMTTEQSQFDVGLWMQQFAKQDVQLNILQPESYTFTVSRLDWMAPELLNEAVSILDKEEQQAEREALEERRNRTDRSTTGARRTNTNRQPAGNRRNTRGNRRGGDPMRDMMGGVEGAAPVRRPITKERTVDDVEKDFDKELLNEKSAIATLRDPLLVWAHDDSAKPGHVYQYRIRVGLFNPIAGKGWVESAQAEQENQLVLWSDYSQPTEPLDLPRRIYLFPMDVIAGTDSSNGADGVQVEIVKYYLGRWRDFDFDIYPGEMMGYEVEDKDEIAGAEDMAGYDMMTGMNPDQSKVDFSTGSILVDIVKETVWGSRMRPSRLHTVLYYDADNQMQQMPVGKSNWPSDTRKRYTDIQKKVKQDVQEMGPGMMPGDMMDPMMMDPMMMP